MKYRVCECCGNVQGNVCILYIYNDVVCKELLGLELPIQIVHGSVGKKTLYLTCIRFFQDIGTMCTFCVHVI